MDYTAIGTTITDAISSLSTEFLVVATAAVGLSLGAFGLRWLVKKGKGVVS